MSTPLADIYAQLATTSSQISERTRTLSVSVIALVWLFLAGGDNAPKLPSNPSQIMILLSGAFALVSLLSDYCQYLFGYLNTDRIRTKAEAAEAATADYDYTAPLYRARTVAFWVKQITAVASVVVLFWAIGQSLCAQQCVQADRP